MTGVAGMVVTNLVKDHSGVREIRIAGTDCYVLIVSDSNGDRRQLISNWEFVVSPVPASPSYSGAGTPLSALIQYSTQFGSLKQGSGKLNFKHRTASQAYSIS